MSKKSKLTETIASLAKHYNKEVVSPASKIPAVRKIPLQLPPFDYVSQGGVPVNRISEFLGMFSGTKTFHAIKAIAEFQKYDWVNNVSRAFTKIEYAFKTIKLSATKTDKKTTNKKSSKSKGKKAEAEEEIGEDYSVSVAEITGYKLRRGYSPARTPKAKRVALIDIEGTYDREWGAYLGVDNEGLIYTAPDTLEEGVNIAETLLKDPDICLVVVDSMSAVGSSDEMDKAMEDEARMAVNASFWNRAIRKFQAAMNSNPSRDATLIVINSSYDKVGFVLGDPTQIRNGNQLKLAKSLSMKFNVVGGKGVPDPTTKEIIAKNIAIENLKNKTGRQYLETTAYYSLCDHGYLKEGEVDVYSSIVELGIRLGFIQRAGAFYTYQGKKIQGQATLIKTVVDDPTLFKTLKNDVYGTFSVKQK